MYWKIKYKVHEEDSVIIEAKDFSKKRIKEILSEVNPSWKSISVSKAKKLIETE
tara:strand:+ start:494 stop:655 length:162 start_codon:yes stop_codon:yes gene_type:complete